MNILFLLPQNVIGGGTLAIYYHAYHLTTLGHNVLILYHSYQKGRDKDIINQFNLKWSQLNEFDFSVHYDIVIATWWETLFEIVLFKADYYFYFIQDDERRFYENKNSHKILYCDFTYNLPGIGIITVAEWLKGQLLVNNCQLNIELSPNGYDSRVFSPLHKFVDNKTLRVLIEGPGKTWFKRIDFCFKAISDIENIEIWFVSRDGYVDSSWKIDRYFENISPAELAEVYRSCDVLLKMSEVESFCLPNLEMMACGGTIITTNFTGHEEYAVNDLNSIIIELGDIQAARVAILKLRDDRAFLKQLRQGAINTAKNMTWLNQTAKFEIALNALIQKYKDFDYSSTKKQIELVGKIKRHQELLLKEKSKLQSDYTDLFFQHHRIEYSIFRWIGRLIYNFPVLGLIIRNFFKYLKIKKQVETL